MGMDEGAAFVAEDKKHVADSARLGAAWGVEHGLPTHHKSGSGGIGAKQCPVISETLDTAT